MSNKVKFSICIPAYNRVEFLPDLLDSILAQDYKNYSILICEDKSPQRPDICAVINRYMKEFPDVIRYIENEVNLGYDANIRKLIAESTGEFCFFMGNDDLMAPAALSSVANVLDKDKSIGYVLKSYGWFTKSKNILDEEIHYFNGDKKFAKGMDALKVGFRRAGVISGLIIKREPAYSCATDLFDGSLYYQMHLAANVLEEHSLYYLDQILVYSRATESPDFGHSESEKGKFTPGGYTYNARYLMLAGVVNILDNFIIKKDPKYKEVVMKDYAANFYPHIKDQLNIDFSSYAKFYILLCKLGFGKYFSFHFYMIGAFILGEHRFDRLVSVGRKLKRKFI